MTHRHMWRKAKIVVGPFRGKAKWCRVCDETHALYGGVWGWVFERLADRWWGGYIWVDENRSPT